MGTGRLDRIRGTIPGAGRIPVSAPQIADILDDAPSSSGFIMGTWPIVKLSLEHCSGALLVGALFAGTDYLYAIMFPNSAVLWWIEKIDFMLAIIIPTGLSIIFLSSFGRIVYDAVVSVWKGGPNVNAQSILA